jgi:hypothetical protein
MENGEPTEPVARVIGYGGAAYGGKSYGMLGVAAIAAQVFPKVQMGYFRRTYPELSGAGGAMFKANEIFYGQGKAKDGGKRWDFETGSQLYFCHCEFERDVFKYQSQDFDIIFFDEATHFTWFQFDYLVHTRNRVSGDNGIIQPFAIASSNPGGIGHAWYMRLFDLENMPEKLALGHYDHPLTVKNDNDQLERVKFIPAFVTDNKIGLDRDPDYPDRLRTSDPDLAEALLNGSWDAFAGQAFADFDRTQHVCKPFDVSGKEYARWRSVDAGYVHPFCCLWFAKELSTGRIYVYRELVLSEMSDKDQAELVATYSPAEEYISITYGDPAMWARKNVDGLVMSTSDEFIRSGVPMIRADNNRLLGKKKIHQGFKNLPDGKPGLIFFNNCANLVSIMPKLVRSDSNPEDVQKQDGDDPYDALRYGLTDVRAIGGGRKEGSRTKDNPYNKLGKYL